MGLPRDGLPKKEPSIFQNFVTKDNPFVFTGPWTKAKEEEKKEDASDQENESPTTDKNPSPQTLVTKSDDSNKRF